MQRKLLILGLFCIGIVLVSVVAVVVPLLLRHEERITEPEQNQQQDDEFPTSEPKQQQQQQDDEFPTLGRFVERPVDELLLEFDDYGPGMTVATSAHGDYIAVGAPFYNHRINGTTDGTNQTITTIRAAGMVRVFYTTRVDNQTKLLPVGQALIGSSRSTYKGSALALSDTAAGFGRNRI